MNCYAEIFAHRLELMGQPKYQGLTKKVGKEIRWTGEVKFVPEALKLPSTWKTPKRVFVNSMSDMFHEKVAEQWLHDIYHVMENNPQHSYQILTKRSGRMREYLTWRYGGGRIPSRHIWHGVSVENQEAADERIPDLLASPSGVRFLSCEPLLGPVDLSAYPWKDGCWDGAKAPRGLLHWVIVGFESGHGARAGNIAWIRSLINQCRDAHLSVFIKQLGPSYEDEGGRKIFMNDKKGGSMEEWPADVRIREFPQKAS
jgi:protein gp37